MLLSFFGFIFTLTLWGSFFPVPFTGINPQERMRDRLGGAVKTALVAAGGYGVYNKTTHAWTERVAARTYQPMHLAGDNLSPDFSEFLVFETESGSYLERVYSLMTGKLPEPKLRPTRVVPWITKYDPMASPNSTVKKPITLDTSRYPPSGAHFMMVIGTVMTCLVLGGCLLPFHAYTLEWVLDDALGGFLKTIHQPTCHHAPGIAVVMDSDNHHLKIRRVPSVFDGVFPVTVETTTARMVEQDDMSNHQIAPRPVSLVASLCSSMGFPGGIATVHLAEDSRFVSAQYPSPLPLPPPSSPSPPPQRAMKSKTNSLALIGPIRVAPEPVRPVIRWQESLANAGSITFHPVVNQVVYRLLLTLVAMCEQHHQPTPSCEIELSDPIPFPQTHALVLRRLDNISPFAVVTLVQLLLAGLESGRVQSTTTQDAPPERRKKQRLSQRRRRQGWKKDMLAKQNGVLKGIEEADQPT